MNYLEAHKKHTEKFGIPEDSTLTSLMALTEVKLNEWIDFEDLKWNHSKTYSYILRHSGNFRKQKNHIEECFIEDNLVWWYYNADTDVCKIKIHRRLTLKD